MTFRDVQIPSSGGPLKAYADDNQRLISLEESDDPFYGLVSRSAWVRCPPIFRLRLTGTGTCTMDARDSLGNISTSVETFLVSFATDQIEFPYAGDNATHVRFTLTGTCTTEII